MSYQLSAEELILALTIIDELEAAAILREQIFPEIGDEELSSKLDTAANGLLAKELFFIDKDDGLSSYLEFKFSRLLKEMISSRKVYRLTKFESGEESIFAVYMIDSPIIHSSRYSGYVHHLLREDEWKARVLQQMFTAEGYSQQEKIIANLDESRFDLILEAAIDQDMHTFNRYVKQVVDTKSLSEPSFFNHLFRAKGILSSFFTITYDPQLEMDDVESFLYLKTERKTWVIKKKPQSDELIIQVANEVTLSLSS